MIRQTYVTDNSVKSQNNFSLNWRPTDLHIGAILNCRVIDHPRLNRIDEVDDDFRVGNLLVLKGTDRRRLAARL